MADPERIGPYRVIQKLGAGGMGEVVLAHDDRLDRLVAIKRLHDDHTATPDRRERFRREARIVARLNHPAIVQIHAVHHEGPHDYLIMEYIEGRTLREHSGSAPMSVSEVLGIAHQIALGMAAAHDLGVIHRDLKAENILITPDGRAKITDFGIAKLHGEDTLTAEGAVLGTFRAMSPEQALGHAIDHRSDLFSFGILLYEALTGVSPFRAETPFLTVQRLVHDAPQPLAELVPAIPDGFASLIHQLLAKEPALRPRDFHEVADALIELAGEACHAPCHGGSSPGGGRQSLGEDTQSTGDGPAPVRSRHTSDGPALVRPRPTSDSGASASRGALATPSSGSISGLDDTADAAVEPPVLALAAGSSLTGEPKPEPGSASGSDHGAPSDRPAPLGTSDHSTGASVPARPSVQRRRLPWYAAAVGLAVLGALGIGYAVRGGGHSGAVLRARLVRVAVLAPSFPDAADRSDVARLAGAVRNAVIADVWARAGLDLVPRDDIDGYVEGFKQKNGSRPTQRDIRTAVSADEVIATYIECSSDSCSVTLERDANASDGPRPESFQLAGDSARSPGATVAAHLRRLYPDHPLRDVAADGSLVPQDQEHFDRLVQDYWAGGHALAADQLLDQLEGIRERKPKNVDVLLFEAEVLRHRYEQTNDLQYARRATGLLQKADQLFPDTYGILSAQFDILLAARQFADAGGVLNRLAVLDPDSSETHVQRALLHWKRHDLELARGELEAAARLDSFSWRVPYYRARVSQDLHDHTATQLAIDQLLERSPGNYAGLALRANEDRETGKLACAEQIYAGLVEREPLYDTCLNLGTTRNLLGWYSEAVVSFHCALDIRPNDPAALLDLAESLLLDGDTGGAKAQFRTLHELLVRKLGLSSGGALEGVDLLIEAQTLGYLGRDDPALATLAREHADKLVTPTAGRGAVYTAALVHAVLGDRDLAARYVKQFLADGGKLASFGFRWFDGLRSDLGLPPRVVAPHVAPSCEAAAAP